MDKPNHTNTINSELSDFFLSQWTWWIMREYKEKSNRPLYAKWNGMMESGEEVTTMFVIDYENNSLIEYNENKN